MKRNTRLTLFVRLLIAAGVAALLMIGIQRLLSKALVAH